jgi:hypothetical protein
MAGVQLVAFTTVNKVALHGSSLQMAGTHKITSSVDDVHPALLIVHRIVAQVPEGIAVTPEFVAPCVPGHEPGAVIVAVPETTDHCPHQVASGVFPARVIALQVF